MRVIDWRRIRLRVVASLLVFVPLALVIFWALGPIFAALGEASDDAGLIHRLRVMAAEKPAYQSALARAQAVIGTGGALYNAGSAELASAQLQNAVQQLVIQADGQIASSAIESPQSGHGLQILAVSLAFSLPQDHLAGLVFAIDTQNPYLIVQSLDVRATDNGVGQGLLNVQMQVTGFGDTR